MKFFFILTYYAGKSNSKAHDAKFWEGRDDILQIIRTVHGDRVLAIFIAQRFRHFRCVLGQPHVDDMGRGLHAPVGVDDVLTRFHVAL